MVNLFVHWHPADAKVWDVGALEQRRNTFIRSLPAPPAWAEPSPTTLAMLAQQGQPTLGARAAVAPEAYGPSEWGFDPASWRFVEAVDSAAAEAGVPPGWEVTVDGCDGAPARQVRVQPLLPARQVPPGGGGAFLLEGFLSTAEASALLAAGGEKLRAGARADSASEEARSKHKGANAARSAGYVSERKSASTSFKGERSNGRLGLLMLSRL